MDIRRLADDVAVVLVSDLHIGGSGGDEIFASATELTDFLTAAANMSGPVEGHRRRLSGCRAARCWVR